MATSTASPDILWLLVRKNNSFLVKRGRGSSSTSFSSEPNNLYNKHSFKYSGLANKKTVGIEAAGDGLQIVLTTTKTRKQNLPKDAKHKQIMKKDFRRMAKTVLNQVQENRYRADLGKPALAKLTKVYKSLRQSKAGGRKSKASKKQLVPRP